jgi:NAD(P)-dependent dehydrogenase (short-subunit alcohol dehydrogenase family)
MTDVLVVIGVGGMGQAIARRQGSGLATVIADFDESTLQATAGSLEAEGYNVSAHVVDVSSRQSVNNLARAAAALGDVKAVVHTAGLSPTQAPASAILAVDLVGVALVLEEFGRVIAPGGAGVVIASMAGHLMPLTTEQETALARTSADELLDLPFVDPSAHPGFAYGIAKHANRIQVGAASIRWGLRGARINSISPGIISTAMGRQELASTSGDMIQSMVESSAAKRLGTAGDIAAAVAFLLGPESAFISGTDLLVDGGVVAAMRHAALAPTTKGSPTS